MVRHRRTDHRMKQIISYLDARAQKFLPLVESKRISPSDIIDAYANIEEIADAIGSDRTVVWKSLMHLMEQGTRIRIFPSMRQRRKLYGSTKLPEMSFQDLTSYFISKVGLKAN
jgi:biotin operon repressor